MSKIDASQFENKVASELETALPSDVASIENAKEIADVLSQFAEETLAKRKNNLFLDNTNGQSADAISTFGTNPQGSNASTGGSRQEGTREGGEAQTDSPQEDGSHTSSEPNNTEEETRSVPNNQETVPEDPEAITPSETTDHETPAPIEETPEEAIPEQTEDSLGFTNPADHPATNEEYEDGNTQEGTQEERQGGQTNKEQQRARQLAAQQQAARSQSQQAQSAKNQEIVVLTTKRSEFLKKAGAMALKGSPVLRIILGVTDTLDVAEFEDGAILSALTSPVVFTAQVYFYIFQNSETKRYIAEKYMKKGILLAAMEMIPFIDILPWDTINSLLLARSVKKGKEGYNKEAAEIAKTIKKIESNQNH